MGLTILSNYAFLKYTTTPTRINPPTINIDPYPKGNITPNLLNVGESDTHVVFKLNENPIEDKNTKNTKT